MKRLATTITAAALAVGGLATAAGPAAAGTRQSATAVTSSPATKFGPWKDVKSVPATFRACNVQLRVTFPVNAEQQRTRKDAGGNTVTEVRGRLVIDFRPVGTHRNFIFDVSGKSLGPYASISYRNGDFLFAATGSNFLGLTRLEQRQTGLTHGARADFGIVITQGPIRVLFRGIKVPRADVITRPTSVIDLCKLINGT